MLVLSCCAEFLELETEDRLELLRICKALGVSDIDLCKVYVCFYREGLTDDAQRTNYFPDTGDTANTQFTFSL